jgi:integrase/recombinase XerD
MTDQAAEALAEVLADLPSDDSKRAYRNDWLRFRAWLERQGVAVVAAEPRHIKAHIASLRDEKKAKATTGRALSVIRAIYGTLVVNGVIEVNPAREVKNTKLSGDPRTPVLNEEQVRALLALPTETWKERRDHLCLCLLFGLGWRRSEVARMCVEDFHEGTVTGIIKGNKTLTVGVPEWVQDKILEWCAYAQIEEGPLLPRGPEKPEKISGDIVYKIVVNAAKRAELKLSPHALRRTNITIGGERGVSLKERQLSVGHGSQAVTERYDKARDAAKKAPGQVFADLVKKREK